MTAEEVLGEQLARQISRLSPGRRYRVEFEGIVSDGVGGWRDGRHPVGWVERVSPGALAVRLVPTEAGRTAAALLEEELLDVVLTGYPPVIRLLTDRREALRSHDAYVFRVG